MWDTSLQNNLNVNININIDNNSNIVFNINVNIKYLPTWYFMQDPKEYAQMVDFSWKSIY